MSFVQERGERGSVWEPGICSEPRTEASAVQLCPERSGPAGVGGKGGGKLQRHTWASLFSHWLVWDGQSPSDTILGKGGAEEYEN